MEGARGRRTRGAGARRRAAAAPAAFPWRQLRNPYPPVEILTEDQVEAIHEASLKVLEDLGLRILFDEARALLRAAGAEVDEGSRRVRFDRGLVLEVIAKAPSTVRLHARNPSHDVEVGGDKLAFLTVGGPPNASDLEQGRRAGSLADFCDFIRLAQHFDVIHIVNQPVEAVDVEPRFRHLETSLAMLTLSDKVPFVFARGRQPVADALEMVRIARGVSVERFQREPSVYTVINTNTPLQIDVPMARGIIDMARAGQLMILTPFTLAGAMAPITLAGALVLQNAEALAGLTLSQVAQPGAPVAYGGFTSNVDMKSGAPAFGTPEYAKAAMAGGQLARRYGLPYRSSNVTASNAPDAQAAYESEMALWGALLGGTHLLMHGAGWLEGGLTASFEKFVLDVEMLQMMAAFFEEIEVTPETLALDAVREVGPGGHFFGAAHTMTRYETAFYAPLVSDWRNFETWQETGSLDATLRANRIYKQVLADFEPPPLDPAIREELKAFVTRRKAEGGAELDGA
ncbi:MAG: trimethylamine methyltransferase family protein [Kiloniellales bacterium]|nr:trimethylamine methyltransferase family protein [Kiloniellales bacterium]